MSTTADVPVEVDGTLAAASGRAMFRRDKPFSPREGKLRAQRQLQAPLNIVKRGRSASSENAGFIRRGRRLAVSSALSGSDCQAMHVTDVEVPNCSIIMPSLSSEGTATSAAKVGCEIELRNLVGAMQTHNAKPQKICVAAKIFERVHAACDTNCRCATFTHEVSLRAGASIANL